MISLDLTLNRLASSPKPFDHGSHMFTCNCDTYQSLYFADDTCPGVCCIDLFASSKLLTASKTCMILWDASFGSNAGVPIYPFHACPIALYSPITFTQLGVSQVVLSYHVDITWIINSSMVQVCTFQGQFGAKVRLSLGSAGHAPSISVS